MIKTILALASLTIIFVSCSKDDTVTELDDSKSNLLESFVVTRNTNGSYLLTHEVTNGARTVYMNNASQNEIHLINDNTATRRTLTRNFDVTNNELSIAFVSENGNSQPKFKIRDDNTSEVAKRGKYGLLDTYSFSYNADSTLQLDFKVHQGVDVDFGYNDMERVNDIYLSEDDRATQLYYSKKYNREADGSLRIDFVQMSNTARAADTKKPQLIFDDPHD